MKQHITVSQLKKLNREQVCKLNTLMNHEWNLTKEEFKQYNWNKILKDTSEYCTIGKMIEVISKFVYDIEIFMGHGYWYATVKITYDNGKKQYKGEFLCDALWNCLKDVLEKVTNDDGQ